MVEEGDDGDDDGDDDGGGRYLIESLVENCINDSFFCCNFEYASKLFLYTQQCGVRARRHVAISKPQILLR